MLEEFTRIVVYVPAAAMDGTRDGTTDNHATSWTHAERIISLYESYEFVGRLGSYRLVCEMAEGVESFIPPNAARPTSGPSRTPVRVSSLRVTTYVPSWVASPDVDRLVAETAAAHPWEHPVIEVDTVRLWMPT